MENGSTLFTDHHLRVDTGVRTDEAPSRTEHRRKGALVDEVLRTSRPRYTWERVALVLDDSAAANSTAEGAVNTPTMVVRDVSFDKRGIKVTTLAIESFGHLRESRGKWSTSWGIDGRRIVRKSALKELFL